MAPQTQLKFGSRWCGQNAEHTDSAWQYKNGKWQALDLSKSRAKGTIRLESKNEPLIITNFRYYNRALEPAELAYDATTDIVRLPVSEKGKQGLIVSLTADDFAVGDTVHYLPNHGTKVMFEAQSEPVIVEEVA